MASDLVDNFCTITETDADTAKYYLEASEGNLDSALEMFFARGAETATTSEANDEVRKPIPQKSDILVEESFQSSYAPLARRPLTHSVFDKFRDLESESKSHAEALREKGDKPAANAKDNQRTELKRKTLESLFRPPLELMHKGVFESAKEAAIEQNRWLLVNVQNSEEFACQTLNRDVWNNPMVKELVEANFILWQIYHDSADGQRFQTYYPVAKFPFLAVIDPRTGELVATFRAVSDASAFCDTAVSFLEKRSEFGSYNNNNPVKPGNIKVKTFAMREKPNLKRKPTAEIEIDDDDDEEDDDIVVIPSSRSVIPKKSKITDYGKHDAKTNGVVNGTECSTSSLVSTIEKAHLEHWTDFSANTGEQLKVMFRLPSGERHILTLSELSQLKAVFIYAGSELNLPFERTEFLLNYPMRVLNKEDPSRTLRDLGFNKQEVIFVEMR